MEHSAARRASCDDLSQHGQSAGRALGKEAGHKIAQHISTENFTNCLYLIRALSRWGFGAVARASGAAWMGADDWIRVGGGDEKRTGAHG